MNSEQTPVTVNSMGYLIVRVFTANGAIPLEQATVVISGVISQNNIDAIGKPGINTNINDNNSNNINNEINEKNNTDGIYTAITTLTTASNGTTERIALPAPSPEFSQQPESIKPFSTYDIQVMLDGYEKQAFYNVPIFGGITSIQPVYLKPLQQNEFTDNFSPYDEDVYDTQNPNL